MCTVMADVIAMLAIVIAITSIRLMLLPIDVVVVMWLMELPLLLLPIDIIIMWLMELPHLFLG